MIPDTSMAALATSPHAAVAITDVDVALMKNALLLLRPWLGERFSDWQLRRKSKHKKNVDTTR